MTSIREIDDLLITAGIFDKETADDLKRQLRQEYGTTLIYRGVPYTPRRKNDSAD